MGIIISLTAFPVIIALILLVTKGDKTRNGVMAFASIAMTAASIAAVVLYFPSGEKFFKFHFGFVNYVVIGIAAVIAIYLIYEGLRHRRYAAPLFAFVQVAALAVFELIQGTGIKVEHNLYVDRFSMILMIFISITGGLICCYGNRYMDRFHQKYPELKDRRNVFFAAIFFGIAAMMGLVIFNNLLWIYLVWEIIIVTSFVLIGYAGTAGALRAAFHYLTWNLFGGLALTAGILILGQVFGTLELNVVMKIGSLYGDMVAIPAIFIFLSGLILAMQIPFSGWLIRGEDFTSPAIAVISCVTSANAGVFLILKLAPVLGTENFAGIMTMMVGGITFLAASLVAVFRPEAAKTVSCSTVASMGLIVACGGIGSAEAVAAGILLLLLHGVSKALMLASAGTAALDHEKYDGRQDLSIRELFTGRPKLAACMLTGTAALFMANFELLIMRYNSLSEFAESGNILLFAALCFGAGAAIFYLAKCMGQLTLIAAEPELDAGETSLTRPVKLLAALTVFLCIVFPLISMFGVMPYLEIAFGGVSAAGNLVDSLMGLIVIVFLVILCGVFYGGRKKYVLPEPTEGVQCEACDIRHAVDTRIFEKKTILIGGILSAISIIISLGFMIGTLVRLLGGAA